MVTRVDINSIFEEHESCELGQRLGISFLRAQREEIPIFVGKSTRIEAQQSHLGLVAISGVIWDCGLALVDFLANCYDRSSEYPSRQLFEESMELCRVGHVLDLGCGTGVVGVAAKLLGAETITFSDSCEFGICRDNLVAGGLNLTDDSIRFVQHNWLQAAIPNELCDVAHDIHGRAPWDIVLCSDVLYEEKSHFSLMRLLKHIRFRRLLLSYKRRQDAAEKKFLEELSDWCDIYAVPLRSLQLGNLPISSLAGLHLFIVIPRQ